MWSAEMANKWPTIPMESLVLAGGQPGSMDSLCAQLEFMRRQTKAQIDAAKYMLWSVLAIAVTSSLNALFAFLMWYVPHIPH